MVLLIITLVAGLALGGTDTLTRDPIAQQAVIAAENARKAALPAADSFAEMDLSQRISAKQGFAGPVKVTLKLDENGAISALVIGDDQFAETAGFGAKALEEAFAAQFIGKTAPLTKADIDGIAGATVTTNAVLEAVNAAAAASAPQVDWCYEGLKDGQVVGYVAQVTVQGFGGPIEVIAGMDTEMVVTGISVGGSNFSETAGLGAKAKEVAFTSQFAGKPAPVKVIKAGGTPADNTVDAITAATITSNAVAGAVNKIADHVEGILFPEGRGDEIVLPERPENDALVFSAAQKGFKSEIYVEASFDATGKVTYISIGDDRFAETDGIGTQVLENAFMAQFIDKQMPLTLGDIDVISGATVSTKAVLEALNNAFAASQGAELPAPAEEEPAEEIVIPETAIELIGAGKGFGGEIKVKVIMDGDKILKIEILEQNETAGLADKSLKEIPAAIVANQTTDFTIDTATMGTTSLTNAGIIEAVNNALSQIAPAAEEAAPAAEYIGVGKGFGGEIKVKVVMEGDKIAAIEILSHGETPGLSDKSLKEIPAAIIANQSTDFTIDTATMGTTSLTNGGIIEAVNDAIKQAQQAASEQ